MFFIFSSKLSRLLGPGHARVKQVDVYESGRAEQAWRAKRREIEARVGVQQPVWVFHGTAPQNLVSIMTEGFRVGGRDVGVANGSAYGLGVYTATGPATPLATYGQGKSVILAIAVEGTQTRAEAVGSDSWTPNGDWIIFKHGAQLLPKYVIHM